MRRNMRRVEGLDRVRVVKDEHRVRGVRRMPGVRWVCRMRMVNRPIGQSKATS